MKKIFASIILASTLFFSFGFVSSVDDKEAEMKEMVSEMGDKMCECLTLKDKGEAEEAKACQDEMQGLIAKVAAKYTDPADQQAFQAIADTMMKEKLGACATESAVKMLQHMNNPAPAEGVLPDAR